MSTRLKSLLYLLGAGLSSGPSYLFIKYALADIHPLTLTFLRSLIGALFLFGLCHFNKHTIWTWKHHLPQFAIMALTLNILTYTLINFGEQTIASSLTGALFGIAVVFTALLSHFFAHERLTLRKLLAIGLGLIGLFTLALPSLTLSLLGPLCILLSALAYAAGTVYTRRHLVKIPPLVAATAQLGLSAVFLFPLALLFEPLPHLTLSSSLATLALGLLGTGTGFYCYFKTIHLAGPTFASFTAFIMPPIALLLGVLILHEPLTLALLLGTALILSSIVLLNRAPK